MTDPLIFEAGIDDEESAFGSEEDLIASLYQLAGQTPSPLAVEPEAATSPSAAHLTFHIGAVAEDDQFTLKAKILARKYRFRLINSVFRHATKVAILTAPK